MVYCGSIFHVFKRCYSIYMNVISCLWTLKWTSAVLSHSYFHSFSCLRVSFLWPRYTIALFDLFLIKIQSHKLLLCMGKPNFIRPLMTNQMNCGRVQQHMFVKLGRFHSCTWRNPIWTCIKHAPSVDSQGHLIHHIPWSSSKIFDQEGYSIIFFLPEIHRRKLLFLYRKSEWWQVSGEEEMCDRHTSLL